MAERDVKELFGMRVRQLRIQKGWSQEDFANHIDLDRSYFGSVERGKRNISLENIFVIAEGLGVPAADLLIFDQLDDPPRPRTSATKPRPDHSRRGARP